jgi:hypothetical protein
MNAFVKELRSLCRIVRRFYYMTFRRPYVEEMLRKRRGTCGKHGCCDLTALGKLRRCIDRHDRTCCLKWDKLPSSCRVYPFDEEDKIPETVPYCSFHWDKESEQGDKWSSGQG